MLFLVVLHYKIRGRPAQARALPENVQWDGYEQYFFSPK
jgi:hypothetical protein